MTPSERPSRPAAPSPRRRPAGAALVAFVALGLLAASCKTSEELPGPAVASVSPATAELGTSVQITIVGERFYVRPEIDLENGPTRVHGAYTATLGGAALPDVARVDATHLTATVPATLAAGTHDLSIAGPYGSATLAAAFTVTPPKPPELRASLTVPDEAGVNQLLSIVLRVENPGAASVAGVVPGALAQSGDGALAVEPATFAPAEIPAGGAAEFTWSAKGMKQGAVALEARALDSSGATLATATASMLVRGTASLAGTASAAPDKVTVGQAITATLGISNPTDAAALGVVASLELSPAGAASVTATPAAQDIAAQGQAFFVFALVAQQAGPLSVAFRAKGADPAGSPVYLNPVTAAVLVQLPASLTGSATALPASVTVGQQISLTLSVANGGEVDALAVAPSTVTQSGVGAAALQGAAPAAQDVPAGASRDFTWAFTATRAGDLTFRVGATGVDANTLNAVTLAPVAAGPVAIAAPKLEVSLDATPAVLNVGQAISVRLTVRNAGTVAANAVVPALSASGTGAAVLESGPAPAQADLAPGDTRAFDWTWRATDPGLLDFEASAAGVDATSGAPVGSDVASAGPVAIARRAHLTGVLVAPPSVAAGTAFDVRLDLANDGDAAALAVVPGAIAFGGSASASVSAGPTPATVDVPAQGTASLAWTVQPAAEGSLTLTVGAAGTDAVDGQPVTLDPVAASLAVGQHAALTAALSAPSLVAPGRTFAVTLTVTNSGAADATAVAPTAFAIGGTGQVSAQAGPSPAAADVAAGKSAGFTWTFSADGAGLVDLDVGAAGTEAGSGQAVVAPSDQASLEVAEAQRLLADPLGDGTAASFLFGYRGKVWVGPRQDGQGAVRFDPDGTSPESCAFALQRDPVAPTTSLNASAAPYPGFGATGCARNTGACGPDNESGRPLLASTTLFGEEWLFGAGAAAGADRLHHAYLTKDAGPALSFPYVDLSPALAGQAFSVSSVLAFHDRLYLGLPDTSAGRPYLAALLATPTAPGLDPALGAGLLDLGGAALPDLGATGGNAAAVALVDAMADFQDRLYLFNNGGCARSTTTAPGSAATAAADWTTCTPKGLNWTRKTSVATAKTSGIEPADKATPQVAVWQGKLFALRNTTTGPQLWSCTPSQRPDGLACDPNKDWTLVAPNATGDARLTQFEDAANTAATLLVATGTSLYVGFDNANGLALYRTTAANPRVGADFQGALGCSAAGGPASCAPVGGAGLGDAGATRIFGAVSLPYGGRGYLYVLAGDGAGPLRVFRLDE